MLKGFSTIAALTTAVLLMGCVGSPYQPKQDQDHSLAYNVFHDSAPGYHSAVVDTANGGSESYHGSGMGGLFGLAGMIGSTPNPAGMMSALSNSNSAEGPLQARPLLFGYWPYSAGDDELTAGKRAMGYLQEALNEMVAGQDNASVSHRLDSSIGRQKLDGWYLVMPSLGCMQNAPCAVRVVINTWSVESLMPPKWITSGQDYQQLLREVQKPITTEGASFSRTWTTYQHTDTQYAQVLFVQQGMAERDLRPLYESLSRHLPDSFYLYLPPEDSYGLPQEYPYMLNDGRELRFRTPS